MFVLSTRKHRLVIMKRLAVRDDLLRRFFTVFLTSSFTEASLSMSPQDPLDEMSVDSKSFQKSIPGFSSVPLALSAPVPSSAGLPSTRSKVKKEAKRPDRSREDDSEDEVIDRVERTLVSMLKCLSFDHLKYHPAKRNRPSRVS
jgi:hypothetical protein